MAKLTITMELDNAAFEGDPAAEIERVLAKAVDKLDRHFGYAPDGEFSCKLLDTNGNTVGRAVVED